MKPLAPIKDVGYPMLIFRGNFEPTKKKTWYIMVHWVQDGQKAGRCYFFVISETDLKSKCLKRPEN